MPERCEATTKAGTPCPNRAAKGGTLCVAHDPERRRAAAAAGGRGKSHQAKARKELERHVLTTGDVEGFIGLLIVRVIAGTAEPAVGNAVANLSRALVAVREAGMLEERLAAVEQAMAEREERDRREGMTWAA